jgi:hypothetical protein
MDTLALDAHPRHCMFCGVKKFECMGFVLARDMLLIIRAGLNGQPIPLLPRELCGRCVNVWDRIAGQAEEKLMGSSGEHA